MTGTGERRYLFQLTRLREARLRSLGYWDIDKWFQLTRLREARLHWTGLLRL